VNILLAWLLADFITGLIHWAEDKFLNNPSRIKFLETVRLDNDLHHDRPAAICSFSWWENINTTAPITIPLAMVLWYLNAPEVIWLAAFFATFANLVHRWGHERQSKLNPVIKYLQRTGLFISFRHHAVHHYDDNGVIEKKDTSKHFCPMTNWLNPALDKIRFFKFLEHVVGGGLWRREKD